MKAPKMELTLFRTEAVYTPSPTKRGGAILVGNGRVLAAGNERAVMDAIRTRHDRSKGFDLEILDLPGMTAVPGFVDTHVHGGGGADFMDATPEAAGAALKTHLDEGTTSIVATLMAAPAADLLRAMAAIDAAAAAHLLPAVLGFHLEGPFISREKRGAQKEEHIRPYPPAPEMARLLKSAGRRIRIVTLAPEIPGAEAFIRFLQSRRIVPSAGHSNATFEQARAGIQAGIRHGTHLFNAMTGLFHRDPGLAGALLLDDRVAVEMIADGIHLHPAILSLVVRIKPLDKIVLVTDASRPAGQSHDPLRTAEGRLFGSAITLARAIRNMILWTGLPLEKILPMATIVPARIAGAGRKGRLTSGADADIVLLDEKLAVKGVFLRGKRYL